MSTKNLRHGRLRVQDGSGSALTKTLAFTDGDFSFNKTKNINAILDRGKLSHPAQGDQQPIDWSFTAKFVDRTIAQLFDEFVFDAQSEELTGLTGGAVNNDVATAYSFRQGSLVVTDGSPFTGNKLAAGGTPSSDGEHAENVGTEDIEGVVVVSAFDVQMPAADTDLNVTYDAVGVTTWDGVTPTDVKTMDLFFDVLSPADLTTVLETYELLKAYTTEPAFEEGDEFNTWTIAGQAFIRTVATTQQVTP